MTQIDTNEDPFEITRAEFANDPDSPMPDESLIGVAWHTRILVMPMAPPKKTGGGIILPQEYRDQSRWLTYVGRVVSVGPNAFKGARWKQEGFKTEDMPKRGEWWLFDPYQFHRLQWESPDRKILHLLVMHETSFIQRVPAGTSPWDFKIVR